MSCCFKGGDSTEQISLKVNLENFFESTFSLNEKALKIKSTGLIGTPIGINDIITHNSGTPGRKLRFNNPRTTKTKFRIQTEIIRYKQIQNNNLFGEILRTWFDEKNRHNREIFSRLYGILTFHGYWTDEITLIIATIEAFIKNEKITEKLPSRQRREMKRIKNEMKAFLGEISTTIEFESKWSVIRPNLEKYISEFSPKPSPTLKGQLKTLIENTKEPIKSCIGLKVGDLESLKDVRDSTAHARCDTTTSQFNGTRASLSKAKLFIIYLMIKTIGIPDELFLKGGVKSKSNPLVQAASGNWVQVN